MRSDNSSSVSLVRGLAPELSRACETAEAVLLLLLLLLPLLLAGPGVVLTEVVVVGGVLEDEDGSRGPVGGCFELAFGEVGVVSWAEGESFAPLDLGGRLLLLLLLLLGGRGDLLSRRGLGA